MHGANFSVETAASIEELQADAALQPSCMLVLSAAGVDTGDHTASLCIALPPEYPNAPPTLELSCPWLTDTAQTREELERLARELTSDAGDGEGRECLMDLAMRLEELLGEAVQQMQQRQAEAAAAVGVEDAQVMQEMVLHIDHMNDPPSYTRLLQQWCAQLGVSCVLLHIGELTNTRLRGADLVMRADRAALSEFAHRLRTEYVDVDARGRKCRERQATILCRRAFHEGAPPLDGWRTVACGDKAHLERELDELGVLHVGVGGSRFAEASAAP